MKFLSPLTVKQLCERFDLHFKERDANILISGINEINRVTEGDICFVDHRKYVDKTISSEASVILLPFNDVRSDDKTLIVVENPFEVYNRIAKEFYLEKMASNQDSSIHPSAKIHPTAHVGKGVKIGENSIIDALVSIHDGTIIGDNVIIESGTVVGSKAFYYHGSKEGAYTSWFSCGHVEIEDDVQIAALCTINRGVSAVTRIGKGTKIDCHVHVGHGVEIGEHCLITAQVGISGKTRIGNHVKIYGQVGITQNLHIGNHVTILAKSGVGDDIPDGETYFGTPAGPAREKMRELFALKQLAKRKK